LQQEARDAKTEIKKKSAFLPGQRGKSVLLGKGTLPGRMEGVSKKTQLPRKSEGRERGKALAINGE